MRARRLLSRLPLMALVSSSLVPCLARAEAPASGRATLTVFAAASLADPFAEIGHRLERERPGVSVRFNFAGSQQLATQIEQGVQADVFASADERWMGHVHERSLLGGEASVFARNRLVVIIPATNPASIERLQDLAHRGVKIVLGAEAVPVGEYSREVLRNLSRLQGFGRDFARRVLSNLVSEEENVRSVVTKVQLGEADAGIVYRSDLSSAVARRVRWLEIPERCNVLASYPMALLKHSPQPEAARAFAALVLSPEGQRILERHGLIPVASAVP